VKALYTLAALLSALAVATPVAFGAARTHGFITDAREGYGRAPLPSAQGHRFITDTRGGKGVGLVADPQYVLVVGMPDARHMALIANARRHGVSVRFSKAIASRQFSVGSNGNGASRVRVAPGEGGGLSWTYPGVLAGLSLALALVIGGVVVAARRRLGKPQTVEA
jgi:hypothetical protein